MKRKTVLVLLLTLGLALVPVAIRGEGAPPGLDGGTLASSNASFEGESAGDQAGTSVAIAGDVNKDGYADLVIGAPFYDDGGNTDAGRVYLFLGGPGGWQLDEGLASADAIYTGAAGDEAGTSVAGAGDVNGDDYPDLVIGSPGYSTDDGKAVLIYGGASIPSTLAANGVLYATAFSSSRLGESVSGVGNVNGDDYDDVLIGSPGYNSGAGQATLWMGATSAGSMSTADYDGESAGDQAGGSVGGAGDVNGDGYADVLIGAPSYNSSAGQVYLVLGGSAPSNSSLSSVDVLYTGVNSSDQAGYSISGGGDVNGDGDGDFIVSAPGYDSGRGKAYLLFSNLVGICSIPRSITCGQQDSGNTTGYASRIDGYDCSTWDESGPEVVYSLTLPDGFAPYDVTATLSDLSADLDVFILPGSGCYQGQCLAYDNLSASASGLSAGTYYIAVDGYNGVAGSYTLSVDCSYREVYAPLVLRNYP